MASEQTASPSHGTVRKITDELGITDPETGREQTLQGSRADEDASDARVREEVCQHLWRGAHLDVREVTVQVSQGIVTLEGTVPNDEMKYAIADIVASCHGVRNVDDRIRVMSPG
jgi:osmotically-inducible protein OsmY